MSVTAPEILEKQPGESTVYYVDFTPLLRKDASGALSETLSGSPTVTFTPSGLTIASEAVNSVAIVRQDNSGNEIAIGAAVQFRVSGGTDQVLYTGEVSCGTTLTNTREVDVKLQVRDA